jgi:Fe-S-cluster-containing dehydrogenase component/formate-dependent nitrite reductase membrane component NrfD
MKYGFVIDNRKCIGCHACTTACKSEHEVPVGVFRTWVKQVEKGTFPNTRRVFSVMRCNHCSDAPCVEICPVEALYLREDGIVDFDKNRCIACKSCMQACPYDALYIDPESRTAAKCNYCAHRVDIGLEPACVNVCPEHAIISGDMENPFSEIAQLLAREQVTARKVAKGTHPNLFYIDGDDHSLIPTATDKLAYTGLSEQSRGIGHFAQKVEKLAYNGSDLVATVLEAQGNTYETSELKQRSQGIKSVEALMGGEAKRYYDAPSKGILWGWEVWSYVTTKAVASGAFLIPFLFWVFGEIDFITTQQFSMMLGTALFFLLATTALLVKDLDQPKRFLYVILRPQWRSWLVKGGYALSIYGGMLTLWLAIIIFKIKLPFFIIPILMWITGLAALVTAVYTAFLFAQAKGRDFWQSPLLVLHMLGHSIAAGAAALLVLASLDQDATDGVDPMRAILSFSLLMNLVLVFLELSITHPTQDAKLVVKMILKGQYRRLFWLVSIGLGILVPTLLIHLGDGELWANLGAAVLSLIGIFYTEKIWVEAPQRIPLS